MNHYNSLDSSPLDEWLYSQPQWDQSNRTLMMIEALSIIERSNEGPSYIFHGEVGPKQYLQTGVSGLTNVSDDYSLPPGTIVWGIGATSNQPQGMKIQLFDRGAKQYLYGVTFGKDNVVTGSYNPNTYATFPSGIFILREPYFVVSPGTINVQIANLSQSTAMIQVVVFCALPLNKSGYVTGAPMQTQYKGES